MVNSPSQRRALITRQSFSPFGNKLVQVGYVNQEQMREASLETRKSGRSLIEILEGITGKPLPPDLLRQYKRQQLFELKIIYGVDSLDPELNQFSTEQINELISTLIPIDICRRYQLVPLSLNREVEPASILVAMVDPDNLGALDDLGRILRPQGLKLRRLVITLEDYQLLIAKYLDEQVKRQEQLNIQPIDVDLGDDLDAIGGLEDGPADMEADLDAALQDAETAPIIALVNKILAKALQEDVSDIHLEPQEENFRVRFRKDGVLRQAFEPLPKKIIPAVISRFKIIADLDIAERRAPQDGRIRRLFQGRKIDFRVSTLPSRYGEKVVLRILDNSSTQLGLDKLISDPESLEIVRSWVSRPFGLILVTGPTGSGKTTTLYSALAECNHPGVNISTAEDPIEYTLPGLTQVQVIREKGLDFATILRAFLRQDPDVILVGETRDKETAKTAIEAALTGHLVLTTLHTNDAASAIARLSEMDIEPFMVSASLIGVVAQRLMRRVCSECKIPYHPMPEELARFGLSASQDIEVNFYKANTLLPEEIQAAKATSQPICPKCNGIGYKGRLGVYEIMQVTERLQSLITEGAPTERIKEVAVEEGMKTLLAYSLNLVKQGETTLEEVERVTFTDTGLEAELKAKRKSSLTCRVCGAEAKPEWLDCPYCTTPRFAPEELLHEPD
jgi:type IV pilus assembly protein PilB